MRKTIGWLNWSAAIINMFVMIRPGSSGHGWNPKNVTGIRIEGGYTTLDVQKLLKKVIEKL